MRCPSLPDLVLQNADPFQSSKIKAFKGYDVIRLTGAMCVYRQLAQELLKNLFLEFFVKMCHKNKCSVPC